MIGRQTSTLMPSPGSFSTLLQSFKTNANALWSLQPHCGYLRNAPIRSKRVLVKTITPLWAQRNLGANAIATERNWLATYGLAYAFVLAYSLVRVTPKQRKSEGQCQI
eukprot:4052575-Amphidinium_carterae.1